MHRQVTRDRLYPDFYQFFEAIFGFFDRTLPEDRHTLLEYGCRQLPGYYP